MTRKTDKKAKEEVEPKFKHFLLAIMIILLIISPFFMIGGLKAKQWNDYLKNNGKETIAFYVYPAGRMSSKVYKFEYKINGKRFTSGLRKPFELPPNYPFEEIPIMVRYADKKPSRSIVLTDKVFNYKGFEIKWITHEKSSCYYLTMKKLD